MNVTMLELIKPIYNDHRITKNLQGMAIFFNCKEEKDFEVEMLCIVVGSPPQTARNPIKMMFLEVKDNPPSTVFVFRGCTIEKCPWLISIHLFNHNMSQSMRNFNHLEKFIARNHFGYHPMKNKGFVFEYSFIPCIPYTPTN